MEYLTKQENFDKYDSCDGNVYVRKGNKLVFFQKGFRGFTFCDLNEEDMKTKTIRLKYYIEPINKIKTRYSVFSSPVSAQETWFAWYPVQTGALAPDFFSSWMWLKRVWRNKCMGVTIYQPLDP